MRRRKSLPLSNRKPTMAKGSITQYSTEPTPNSTRASGTATASLSQPSNASLRQSHSSDPVAKPKSGSLKRVSLATRSFSASGSVSSSSAGADAPWARDRSGYGKSRGCVWLIRLPEREPEKPSRLLCGVRLADRAGAQRARDRFGPGRPRGRRWRLREQGHGQPRIPFPGSFHDLGARIPAANGEADRVRAVARELQ